MDTSKFSRQFYLKGQLFYDLQFAFQEDEPFQNGIFS